MLTRADAIAVATAFISPKVDWEAAQKKNLAQGTTAALRSNCLTGAASLQRSG